VLKLEFKASRGAHHGMRASDHMRISSHGSGWEDETLEVCQVEKVTGLVNVEVEGVFNAWLW
jgi:hypothetical protein